MKIQNSIESMISFSQFDYTGKRLAVISSDHVIHLYSYIDATLSDRAILDNHHGDVLSLSWSHPKFGSLLASSGSDGKILIWREQSLKSWSIIFEHNDSTYINCVSFAPWELGLKLLAGLEDGSIIIVFFRTSWVVEKFQVHSCAITALAWSPPVSLISMSQEAQHRFVLGTSDGKVKLITQEDSSFTTEVLEKHTGCIRDISWNPIISSNKEIFASATERVIIIWVRSLDDRTWKAKDIFSFPGPIWKLSWNAVGTALAISAADNYTRVIKENSEEVWKVVQQINPKGEVIEIGEN